VLVRVRLALNVASKSSLAAQNYIVEVSTMITIVIIKMENRYLREYIVIQAGCTPGWVELVRTNTGIYILNMLGDVNPENRWIWPFTEAIMKAFEAIEEHLEHHGGDGPSALLTISSSNKFFSNGIDPTGEYTKSLRLDQIQSKNSKLYNT